MQIKTTSGMRDEDELYQLAIEEWGVASQMGMVQEECAELIQAVSKYIRKLAKNPQAAIPAGVYEEAADVDIMLGQLKELLDAETLEQYKRVKLERLAKILNL